MIGLKGPQQHLSTSGQALASSPLQNVARESEPRVRPLAASAKVAGYGAGQRGHLSGWSPDEDRSRPQSIPTLPTQNLPRVYADYWPSAFAGAFLAQAMSQGGQLGPEQPDPEQPGAEQFGATAERAAALGSDAYRRAGGEPALYGEAPSVFRIAV